MKKCNALLLLSLASGFSPSSFIRAVDPDRDMSNQIMREPTEKEKKISSYFIQQLNDCLRTFSEKLDLKFKDELGWLQTNYSDNMKQGDEYVAMIMEDLRSFFHETVDSIKAELDKTLTENDELAFVQELHISMKRSIPAIIEQATNEFKRQICMRNSAMKEIKDR